MVSTALYTGLSGLRVHQTYIDVIGNNLANVSTPGFRGSRATFSDILSFTVRSGSGPNGNFGGQNPMQIGTGAFMAAVDTDLNQGTLQDTGRSLDVALQGRGFFTLSNGLQNFYSRVGSFTIDANRALVDGRTGLRVVNSTGNFITVPTSDTLPAQPTSRIEFQGNLPAEVGGPLAEILESNAPLSEGTAANKTGNPPSAGTFDLSGLAGAEIKVSVNGGAQQTLTVPDQPPYNAGPVAAADIVTWLNGGVAGFSGISGATASVSGTSVSVDTIRLGSSATLKFDNVSPSQNVLAALGLDTLLESGTETTADTNSDLNALTARNSPYSAGDAITVSGTNPDGTAFSDTFIYGTGAGQDGVTLGALINFVNQTIDSAQATASLTAGGNIRLSAINKEEADLSLFIGDNSSTGGTLSWPNFEVAQEGTGPDVATTSAIVVDSRGRSHSVSMTFTRSTTDATVWDMQAELTDATGNDAITQASIGQIRFNDNGSFNVIGGGTNSMAFSWDGISAGQSVTIDLGTSGQFDGISMLGDTTTVAAVDQDGYDAGTLLDVGFSQNGELIGIYSNGQSQTLDTLRVTMFSNEGGLVRQGDTLYGESPNSGDAIATTANAAGAGSVRAGQLENSNVDIAREFVNLIEAQRGFQANSRVITTTDEILAELMNIVR